MKSFPVLLVLCGLCFQAGCKAKVTNGKTEGADSTKPDIPEVVTEPPFPEAAIVGVELKQSFRKPVKDKDGKRKAELLVIREEKPKPGVIIKYLFEPISVGPSQSHTFTLKNNGKGPLTVAQGGSSCQCTIAGLGGGKTRLKLKTGETTQIELKWEAKVENPQFRHSAAIYTSDPKTQLIVFELSGQIVQPIESYPKGQWAAGVIRGSEPKKIEGYLSSRVFNDLKIDKLDYDSTVMKVEHKRLNRDEIRNATQSVGGDYQNTKVMYKFDVTVLPAGQVGRFRHRILVKTKLQQIPLIPIDVSGVRAGPLFIQPESVKYWNQDAMGFSLGDFPASKGKTGSLRLFVEGLKDKELKITKVESDPDYIKVKLEPAKLASEKNDEKKPDKKEQTENANSGNRKLYRLTFTIPPGIPTEIRTRRDPARVTIHTNFERAKTIAFMILFDAQ